jgi:hypothetical protein
LESNRQDSLKFQSKYYSDDSHGSVPLITEYDALHFIFDYYPLKLTGKDFTDTTTTLVDKFENHFANISKQMGYKVKPLESMINSAGYNALNSRKFKLAERFFRLNITNYPESFNVFDSMGDYYAAIGDKTNAIINYQKSLSIKDFADTRKKLEKLKNK